MTPKAPAGLHCKSEACGKHGLLTATASQLVLVNEIGKHRHGCDTREEPKKAASEALRHRSAAVEKMALLFGGNTSPRAQDGKRGVETYV